MNLAGAFFVMRPKNNMKFEVVRVLNGDNKPSTVRSDYIVRLVVPKSKKLYPDKLRLVKALDPDSGEIFTFVTNSFDFLAIEIANIYRHRWDIEVFFYDKRIIMQSWRQSHIDVQPVIHTTSRFNFA